MEVENVAWLDDHQTYFFRKLILLVLSNCPSRYHEWRTQWPNGEVLGLNRKRRCQALSVLLRPQASIFG